MSFNYVGVLQEDGSQFDSNFGSGTPKQVTIGATTNIDGWNEGLLGVKKGDEIQLDIPADMAYGAAGSTTPVVPPDAAVSYVIQVTDVLDVPDIQLPDGRVEEITKTVLDEGPGEGRVAQQFDTVDVYFSAVLSADGTQIAGNFGTGSPAPMVLGQEQFLPGIDAQLEGVQAGDVVQIDVPAKDALGDTGSSDGSIPPDADLTFLFQIEDVTGPPLIEVPDEPSTELTKTVITPGSGPEAVEGDTVLVNYVGVLQDGNKRFASNWDGELYPVTLGAGDVIPGWDQGLVGVQAGEELQLDIPADLAYGSEGQGDTVPPDSALSFLFKVAAVVPADSAANAPTPDELPVTADPIPALITSELHEGDGDALTEGSLAYIDVYMACAHTGVELENTYVEDQRALVSTAQGDLMEGLRQGLLGMKVGGTRAISIPADLAFADQGNADLGVGPGQDIIVVATLYGFTSPPAG